MIDLLPILMSATTTMQLRMKNWFAAYPAGMPWTIVSDYCLGDEGKKNDVFSFVVIANHDKTENISEYISGVAPRDIKNIRQVPLGLMQYLTSPQPVTFSVSFVINRDSALLRDYLRVEDMASFIPDACELVRALRTNSPASSSVNPGYFDEVLRRLGIFEKDLGRKQMNEKLSRQIHLASGFAATLFYLVTNATGAGYLRWISDRDKLIEHNDTIVYDLAYLYFILMSSSRTGLIRNDQGNLILDLPKTLFELPEKTGQHRFDALIRLPDYLAGTLADIGPDMSYSKEKFREMLLGVFVDSPNNWLVHLTSNGERISARSVQYRS
ncbi:hypothetical protein OPV09_27275 [Janthinobacterium sp. TB1-E2]|uniref:Uncharacterized protein n=1 Tax=Janthinobacterium aestuarii TaxID=2985511 RepID=A0ABZ2GQP9_9BURK